LRDCYRDMNIWYNSIN